MIVLALPAALSGDLMPGAPRWLRRAACAELGHAWTFWAVPAGTVRCRRCARWEASPERDAWDETEGTA